MNLPLSFNQEVFVFCSEVLIFLILTFIGAFIYKRIINSPNRYLNPKEFLPDDEIFTLRQVFYLIIMGACFFCIIYTFVSVNDEIFYLAIFDIVLSLYFAIRLEGISLKNVIIFLFLVPFGSLTIFYSFASVILLLDLFHIFIYAYYIKVYYDKFKEFTNSNGLGISILLLFLIVFLSFLVTLVTEGVNPLDSLVMVSNAFTSNGFTVLGDSIIGKINSLFLVWGGYIISGAATATLTATILIRRFNKRFEELEKLIEDGSDEND